MVLRVDEFFVMYRFAFFEEYIFFNVMYIMKGKYNFSEMCMMMLLKCAPAAFGVKCLFLYYLRSLDSKFDVQRKTLVQFFMSDLFFSKAKVCGARENFGTKNLKVQKFHKGFGKFYFWTSGNFSFKKYLLCCSIPVF